MLKLNTKNNCNLTSEDKKILIKPILSVGRVFYQSSMFTIPS